jgi:hypothetical protein
MNMTRTQTRIALVAMLYAGLIVGAGQAVADITGRTGKAQSSGGCNCHGSALTPGVVVTITGPQSVATGATNNYTVTVSGGPATSNGGFNLKATAGTLTAGANNRVSGLEVTHNTNIVRSWTFAWKAPATAGPVSFYAIAVAADGGDDTAGDDWNFYGGAVNTAFVINVAAATGVGDEPGLTWIAPPLPNPCVNGTQITYSLATAANVKLTVLDATGRIVRTLEEGARPAGRASVSWNGRTAEGSRVPAGIYFVQMAIPGRVLSTRLTVID